MIIITELILLLLSALYCSRDGHGSGRPTGRVGSGQSLCGSGRVWSRKSDPRPSVYCSQGLAKQSTQRYLK